MIGLLAKLADDDPEAAREALAALDWITGEQDLRVLTQERLQTFLWYELPSKWMTEPEDKVTITASLARALDLLDLPRYAEICRSVTTTEVLEAYQRGYDEGRSAFRRASAASGIEPPDVKDFKWGAIMGFEEASAMSSTADMLEEAIAAGQLVPGARGWKTRQQQLTATHLGISRDELAGQSLGQLIVTERIETWLEIRCSDSRRRALAAIANRLLHPAGLAPADAVDPLPLLSWFLGALDEGVALTQTGNLNRSFVQAAAPRLGWDFSRPPRNEEDLFGLHQLRRFAQRLGLAHRSGRNLVLTAKGRRLMAEPEQLWRVAAQEMLHGKDFQIFSGELFLALLLDVESMPYEEIEVVVGVAAAEEGYRDERTGQPPDGPALSWAVAHNSRLWSVLGLLSRGGDWRDRSYGLTEVGKVTALEALRARATGPRTHLRE